jgi:hypothetical protein
VLLGAVQNNGGLFGIAFGGGGPGGGGGGGGGGRFEGRGPGGPEGGPGGDNRGGGGPNAAAFVDRLIPRPLDAILLLRDTLHLSAEQVTRLTLANDSLKARNDSIRAEVGAAITAAFQGGGAAAGDPQAIFRRIGPRLNEGRQNVQKALDEAEHILTPEQWRRVPAAVRNAVRQQLGVPR